MNSMLKVVGSWVDNHAPSLLMGFVALTLSAVVLWPLSVHTVPAGHLGVAWKRFGGGTVVDHVYQEGTRLILPWDLLNVYDARLQRLTRHFDVVLADSLNVSVEISIHYRIDRDRVGYLHRYVGPGYVDSVLIPLIASQARDIFAKFHPDTALTESRTRIEESILRQLRSDLDKVLGGLGLGPIRPIAIEDILVGGLVFPPEVAAAIEKKNTERQLAELYQFRLVVAQREADRKAIEGQGIRKFQDSVQGGLTEGYLRYKAIEATLELAKSPNSKIIVFGSSPGGLPLLLGNTDGAASAWPPAAATLPGAPKVKPIPPAPASR